MCREISIIMYVVCADEGNWREGGGRGVAAQQQQQQQQQSSAQSHSSTGTAAVMNGPQSPPVSQVGVAHMWNAGRPDLFSVRCGENLMKVERK